MNGFRLLKNHEITCRKSKVNAGGVSCLLYPSKFAVPDILDETFGIQGWTVENGGDGEVMLSVFTKNGRKVSRIGRPDADSEGKALVSEALTHAGAYFGIGRELYTAPEIFFWWKDIKNYKYDAETREGVCYDMFNVDSVAYEGGSIAEITVSIINCKDRKKYLTKTFVSETAVDESPKKVPEKKPEGKTEPYKGIITLTVSDEPSASREEKKADVPCEPAPVISDDEKILVGNCKGQTYGEAKGTETFRNFLKWARTANKAYSNPKQNEQFAKLKKLAEAS